MARGAQADKALQHQGLYVSPLLPSRKPTSLPPVACLHSRLRSVAHLSVLCAPSPSETDSIFHDPESGILFASFKYVGYDFEGDMEKMRANPRVCEWWRMTDGFQASLVPGATSSEAGEPSWWKPIEEVFYTP